MYKDLLCFALFFCEKKHFLLEMLSKIDFFGEELTNSIL